MGPDAARDGMGGALYPIPRRASTSGAEEEGRTVFGGAFVAADAPVVCLDAAEAVAFATCRNDADVVGVTVRGTGRSSDRFSNLGFRLAR